MSASSLWLWPSRMPPWPVRITRGKADLLATGNLQLPGFLDEGEGAHHVAAYRSGRVLRRAGDRPPLPPHAATVHGTGLASVLVGGVEVGEVGRDVPRLAS